MKIIKYVENIDPLFLGVKLSHKKKIYDCFFHRTGNDLVDVSTTAYLENSNEEIEDLDLRMEFLFHCYDLVEQHLFTNLPLFWAECDEEEYPI